MITGMDAELLEHARTVDPTVLGSRVREARLARQLTQTAVAGKEMSTAYVSRIEAGQRRPDPELIAVIAERLGVPLDQLLMGTSRNLVAEQRLTLDWAELSLRTGDADAALRQVDDVLAQNPTADIRTAALRVKAGALENLPGRLDDAIIMLEDLIEHGAEDSAWLADVQALSRYYRTAGDLSRAIEVGERGLARLEELGVGGGDEGVSLSMAVAAAYFERGDTSHAGRLIRRAVVRAEQYGSREALAKTYWNASVVESRNHRTEAAIPLARKALAIMESGEDSRNVARLRTQLGLLELRLDDPDPETALDHLRRAEIDLRLSDAGAQDLTANRLYQSRALYLLGRVDEAREYADVVRTSGTPLLAADACVVMGLVAMSENDQDQAMSAFRDAALHLSAAESDRGVAQVWYELGGLLESVADTAGAIDAYRRAGASTGLRSTESVTAPVQAHQHV